MSPDHMGDRGSTTLLLVGPGTRPGLTLRSNRWWVRLVARLRAASLDLRLAEGRPPETSVLLAARAQALVAPAERQRQAELWARLVDRAARPPVVRSPRAPVNGAAICACVTHMADVYARLTASWPISARGVAMVNHLLRDGTGPLYNRRAHTAQLYTVLSEIIDQLTPDLAGRGFADSVEPPRSVRPSGRRGTAAG